MFDSLTLAQPSVDMDKIREWGGEICSSYFNAGAVPTDTLTKIARSESLTPDHIQVLAAEANKAIHNAKYANMKEKYHAADFPLADAKTAICALQVDGGNTQTKIAAVFQPPKMDGPELDLYKAFGIDKPGPMDKTAGVTRNLKVAGEKLSLMKQKVDDKIILTKEAAASSEVKFLKMARQAVLEGGSNFSERMKVIGTLGHFAKIAAGDGELPKKASSRVMAKLCYAMGKEGMITPSQSREAMEYYMGKTADQKAPAALISENLQAQVINGTHPLYITLKTICDNEAEVLRHEGQSKLIAEKAKILGQKVRAL